MDLSIQLKEKQVFIAKNNAEFKDKVNAIKAQLQSDEQVAVVRAIVGVIIVTKTT
jgi:hypothetical protein